MSDPFKITLKGGDAGSFVSSSNPAARAMNGFTLRMPHLPRVGDCIRDGDYGTVTVTRVIFDANSGDITLEIE
jgi:hypothetical protein